jgi:DNA-binding response OmpR family regulator
MSPTGTILIVDDEAAVLHFFQKDLQRAGFQVTSVASGEQALERIAQQENSISRCLIYSLQDMSGLDILEQLQQQWPATPVIIITAHASLETAVKALRQGAHDYLIKPCSIDELHNSVRAGMLKRQHELQRRATAPLRPSESANTAPSNTHVARPLPIMSAAQPTPAKAPDYFLQIKDLTIDSARHVARVGNATLDLSPVELSILSYLARESPRVVSAEELVSEIWGYIDVPRETADTLRSHIYHIRMKIRAKTDREIIRTLRGVGYVIDE